MLQRVCLAGVVGPEPDQRGTARFHSPTEPAAVVPWGRLGLSFGDVCREIPETRGNLADDGARLMRLGGAANASVMRGWCLPL